MSQNPEIQRKARAEVDTLTQRTRPPRSSDRDKLPYLNAVLKEVLRTHPVGPLGASLLTTAGIQLNDWWPFTTSSSPT